MNEPLGKTLFTAAFALSAVVHILLAYITWRRGSREPYLRAWLHFCLASAGFSISLTMAGVLTAPEFGLSAIRLGVWLGSISTLAFFRFAILFTWPVRGGRWIIAIAVLWAGVLMVLFWGTRLIIADAVPSEFSNFAPVAGPLMPLYSLYTLLGWALPVVLFIRTLRQTTGHKRTQAAYMLVAFGSGMVAASSTLLPAVLGSQTLLAVVPALILPLMPLTITYAIIRHRLWEVRTIVHRTSVWLVLSAGLFLPLYGIFLAGAALEISLAPDQLAIVLTIIFLLAHAYLRAVQPRLDHLFQRRAYDRRKALDKYGRDMAAIGRPDEVAEQLFDTLGQTLYPDHMAIVFACDDDGGWRKIARGAGAPAWDPAQLDPNDAFIQSLVGAGAAVDRSHAGVDPVLKQAPERAEAHFALAEAEVCLPLIRGGELIGIIYLGRKQNLRAFSRDDLEFLEQLGAATTIGLSNALLFERVDAQRQDLEELASTLERRVRERTGELERVNDKLSRAYQDLKDLDRLKSRFFANISHEFRTPLTLILSPLQEMLAGNVGVLDETQQRFLAEVRRSGLELLKLIEDLLDLSRLEESRLRLRLERVSLRALVARLVDFAKPLAERKEVVTELVGDDDVSLEADEGKLERVLVNLLTNAYKFTEPGGKVTIAVGESAGNATVSVKDNGIGIPASDLERIFDRFHQVDDPATGPIGGTGIGLALAKELVDLHGGTLRVQSELGVGSTFVVEIPLVATVPEEARERRAENMPVDKRRRESDTGLPEWLHKTLSNPEVRFLGIDSATDRRLVPRPQPEGRKSARLLVADDNPDVLKFLSQVLTKQYELWMVQDGERAWELLLRDRHDLVLADVMMPGLNGLDLCRRLKADVRTQDIPVVLLTARGDTTDKIDGHGVGADHYMTKPFDISELLAVIENLLIGRLRRTEAASRRRSASLETLLAGMAHELRNACHQLRGSHSVIWELSRSVFDGDCDRQDRLLRGRLEKMDAISRRALARISRVVSNLRQYASQGMQVPWSDNDFDTLVAREVKLVEAGTEKNVYLELATEACATLRGPTEEIRQLVLNLVENAVAAVDPGGKIVVRTEATAGKLRLRVSDNGPGMPPDVQEQVFDPFFTTKPPGQGMGLGLALCKKSVTNLGGRISLDSRLGEGTEFIVELPAIGLGPPDPMAETLETS